MNILTQLSEYLQYPKSLERLGICSTCEFLNKETLTCNKCGCNMKIKVLLPPMECPIKKW